jgi:hypothetical protein
VTCLGIGVQPPGKPWQQAQCQGQGAGGGDHLPVDAWCSEWSGQPQSHYPTARIRVFLSAVFRAIRAGARAGKACRALRCPRLWGGVPSRGEPCRRAHVLRPLPGAVWQEPNLLAQLVSHGGFLYLAHLLGGYAEATMDSCVSPQSLQQPQVGGDFRPSTRGPGVDCAMLRVAIPVYEQNGGLWRRVRCCMVVLEALYKWLMGLSAGSYEIEY